MNMPKPANNRGWLAGIGTCPDCGQLRWRRCKCLDTDEIDLPVGEPGVMAGSDYIYYSEDHYGLISDQEVRRANKK